MFHVYNLFLTLLTRIMHLEDTSLILRKKRVFYIMFLNEKFRFSRFFSNLLVKPKYVLSRCIYMHAKHLVFPPIR